MSYSRLLLFRRPVHSCDISRHILHLPETFTIQVSRIGLEVFLTPNRYSAGVGAAILFVVLCSPGRLLFIKNAELVTGAKQIMTLEISCAKLTR